MPSIGVNPFKFMDGRFTAKPKVLALSVGEDFVILACIVSTPACDSQTDNCNTGPLHSRYLEAVKKSVTQRLDKK